MGNWEDLVDDQRRELVLWMRNNLAELTGAAIYSFDRRWRPIWRKRDGGRREGRFTDAGYRGIHWRVDSEDRQATYCDQLRRGNKTIAWQARVNGNHHRNDRVATSRRKWMGDRAATMLRFHPRRDLFTRSRYPRVTEREHSVGVNPSTRITGGEVQCICWSFSVYCTMGSFIQGSDLANQSA
jgi:hypothetical protein